jgi:hypothetical protein
MAWMAALAIGASAAGLILYQRFQASDGTLTDSSGFDISLAGQKPSEPQTTPLASAPENQSSLGMVKPGLQKMHFGAAVSQDNSQAQPTNPKDHFTTLVYQSENKIWRVAERYSKKYPLIAQYGREWQSHPDLRKLNDDYMRDHNPIKFLHGLIGSKNFGKMLRKYATEPTIMAFLKDAAATTPTGAMAVVTDYLNNDRNVKSLVGGVIEALGLPAGILNWSGSKPNIDPEKILNSAIQNNPELEKQLKGTTR